MNHESDSPDCLLRELRSSLDIALRSTRCVSAWLGFGDVLFLGLGCEITPLAEDGSYPYPPYEIQTHFADWSVERDGSVTSCEAVHDEVEAAARSLVGLEVIAWDGSEVPGCLAIMFDGNARVRICSPPDSSDRRAEAWALRLPTGRHLVVRCDGSVVSSPDGAPAGQE